MTKPTTVDEYIAGFPKNTAGILKKLQAAIKKAAPQAEEGISYSMPCYKLHGMLVCFAAHPNHIGFYPMPSGMENFEKELSSYKGAKGSVQFPIDKPLPLGLITEIVKFRVHENLDQVKLKTSQRSKISRR